ncbi:hypothetical protein V4Y02_23660, partial [Escherichia coli]
ELCGQGLNIYLDKVYAEVTEVCESACGDNEKGPYYAVEIIKRCLSALKMAIEKKNEQIENADVDVPNYEHQLMVDWRAIHGAFGLFGT